MKTVAIIDGNYLMYRSHYASVKWTDDRETNVVNQFSRTISHVLNKFKFNKIIVVFDSRGGSSYRKKIYKDYKINRTKMPDEIIKQKPLIKQMLKNRNITYYLKEGYEADDLIGIFSNKLKNKFDKVYIITSDKDMFQLITNNILVIRYINKEWTILGKNYVKNRYGIDPEQFSDYLTLVGDKADNILKPIKGIGPKTAANLLNKYGNVFNMVKFSPYKQYKDKILLNKKLATIMTK